MSRSRVPLPGGVRTDVATIGDLDPATEFEVTMILRRRRDVPAEAFLGPPLTRDELGARYGADPDRLAQVVTTVEAAGARSVAADPIARTVRVHGSAQVLAGLFGTRFRQVHADAPGTRTCSSGLNLPAEIGGSVLAVLGLDDRPQAAARYRVAAAADGAVSYTPLQLASAYGMPEADGAGERIAIIELGGGYGSDDLDTYFGGLSLATPDVSAVGVDGGSNQPGKDPQGADGEVLLDIEVAGAIAPAASIVVYFAPNTDAGFLDAITQAAHASPAPTAMSISWGQSEDQWSEQARNAMDAALADAALLGITVTAAAGDSGSSDKEPTGAPHCDFPASSPHVLGCGGTSLHLDADGALGTEVVWNDGGAGGSTGGGVSDAFPLPDWQAQVGVPLRAGDGSAGRGVPDVAAVADPQTGYQVLVDGTATVIGGTSAVAPLWAGLVCRIAQLVGHRLGLAQPGLYAGAEPGSGPAAVRDITRGSNGAYTAASGWDPCTGLGVPDTSTMQAFSGSRAQ